MTDQPAPPVPPAAPLPPAGWYPEVSTGQQRWWDGTKWTEHTAPPAAPAQPQVFLVQKNLTNGIAVAALILSIAGAALSLIPLFGILLCWLPAMLGIIFGFIGLSNAKKLNGLRHRLALWGVILGFAPVPITVIYLIVSFASGAISGHYSKVGN